MGVCSYTLILHFLITPCFQKKQAGFTYSGKTSGEDIGLSSDLTYRNSLSQVVSEA